MYSVEDIREILAAFDKSKATVLEIESADGEKLSVKQKKNEQTVTALVPADELPIKPAVIESSGLGAPFIHEEKAEADDGSSAISSPMVGVFYAAPAPDKEPYVSVGSKVKKGDVLCLIEAMKLMNEVIAEQDGEIVKICVDNGQVVEFGQPLFVIK